MNDLIKSIQADWVKAKAKAQQRCERAGRHEVARKLASCKMFAGYEDLEDIVRLIFSPQGIEFMTSFDFPNIDTFRKFKPYNPERFGVYIDSGHISLSEARNVFLVGDTTAELKYHQTAQNRVHLMCGARATLIASGYSIVKVESDRHSSIAHITNDHPIVL